MPFSSRTSTGSTRALARGWAPLVALVGLALSGPAVPLGAGAVDLEEELEAILQLEAGSDAGAEPEAEVPPGEEAKPEPGSDPEAPELDAFEAAGSLAPPELPGVEDIVIRGEKQSGIPLDETVSITEFDAEALEAMGAQDISDLAIATPNLEINTISASTPTFFIRGVGLNDFASNATGAVAIYQDGVPINAPALQLGQMFDVEGVQVKRGPQAYGNERNASAGVIDVQSRRPSGDPEARLRFDYGRFDSHDVEGALSLPLTRGGELATRLAFRFSERDPFVRNRCGGLAVPTLGACGSLSSSNSGPIAAGLPTRVADRERWALRGLLLFEPEAGDSEWLLNLHGSAIDQDAGLGQVIGTGANVATTSGYVDPAVQAIFDTFVDSFVAQGLSRPQARRAARQPTLEIVTDDIGRAGPFANDYNLVGQEQLDSFGGSLRGSFRLGDVEIQSISGAERYDRTRLTDFDFSPDTAIHTRTGDEAWQATQSLHLEHELESLPLTWRLGGFFLAEDLDADTSFTFNFTRGGTNQFLDQRYNQQARSFGVYGSFEWDFHEAFTLAGGLRFNWDRKDFELGVRRPGSPAAFAPSSVSETWMAPTGSLSLTFRPTDDAEIYAKYTRGWKPGVFNSAILRNSVVTTELSPEIKTTQPEQLDALEVGANAQLLDGTVELRAALFYYKYVDYQVFILRSSETFLTQFEIVNANNAEIYGFELDLFAEPLSGRLPSPWQDLVVEARMSWLESKFLDFTDTRTRFFQNLTVTEVIDFTGNRLPNTPRFKFSGSLRLPIDLYGWGTLTPRWDVTFTDDVFFDPSQGVGSEVSDPLPRFAIGQKAYTLHNFRLGYRLPNDQIEIAGWVRNLSDERYKAYAAEASNFRSLLNWVGEPRTYGFSLGIEW